MTTFTITCPPTVAAKTTYQSLLRTLSFSQFLVESGAISDGTGAYDSTYSESLITDSASNVYSTRLDVRYDEAFGIPPGDDLGATEFIGGGATDSFNGEATFSWDGARTVADTFSRSASNDDEQFPGTNSQGQTVWTAEQTTSSQTTTTQTATVYQTSFTDTTSVTTRTGTLVQTGTMTALEPRTTVTQTEGFTTLTGELETTRVTTTTKEDTFNRWRTGEGGGTHRGTFQSATVVVLQTLNLLGSIRPEVAWVVTSRPDFTLTSSFVAEMQNVTQFTVFPSFQTTAGHVEQGTYLNDDVGFTFSTSIEEIETPTTYTTTVATGTTISLASAFTTIPSPINEQVGTTISTQSWSSTIREPRYTGGDTSTTTSFSETTHQGRIGTVTWNATHRRSTTLLSSFTFETAYTLTSSGEFELDSNAGTANGIGQSGYTETKTITFERPISVAASIDAPSPTQNQCGSSLSFAVAAASNVSEAAQSLAAGGVSVNFPPLVSAARTAQAPLGRWSYVTAGTSVTASAGPSGLSATSASGPSGSIVTESEEGAWELGEAAISRANLSFEQRINLGGTPPTGTATAFYNAGIFSTTGAAGSGTIRVNVARTESIDTNAQRTAYVPATGVFISAGTERYGTTRRNITALIPEDTIITRRGQLVL
jgi:hypothetical protein